MQVPVLSARGIEIGSKTAVILFPPPFFFSFLGLRCELWIEFELWFEKMRLVV